MKKTLVISVILLISGMIFAHGFAEMREHHGMEHQKGFQERYFHKAEKQPDGMRIGRIMERLELTEDQREKMQDMRVEMQKAKINQMAEIEILQIDEKIALEEMDFDKAKKASSEIFKLKSEIRNGHLNHLAFCWEMLSDEQKEEARQMMKEKTGNMKRERMERVKPSLRDWQEEDK